MINRPRTVTLDKYKKPKENMLYSWKITYDGKAAGHVHISKDNSYPELSKRNIDIHVNANMRRKGIGTEAYRLACSESGLSEVYAHMRKSNIASRRAAEKAGFVQIEDPSVTRQVVMVWKK